MPIARGSGPDTGGRSGARRSGGNGRARPAVAALAGDLARQRRVPGPRCRPDAYPCRRVDHGPRGGRCIPAARTGGNRAGPGHRALLRRHDHPQLHRPARLRPHPSRRHSRSGRPHATGKADAVRWLNAIEVPQRPASPPELALGGPVHASRQIHRPHPARLPGRRPKVPGAGDLWPVACTPALGWTGCYERAPGRRGVTRPGPRTAQSRSARSGGGASRYALPRSPRAPPTAGRDAAPGRHRRRPSAQDCPAPPGQHYTAPQPEDHRSYPAARCK
jgi:hypothetical protein